MQNVKPNVTTTVSFGNPSDLKEQIKRQTNKLAEEKMLIFSGESIAR